MVADVTQTENIAFLVDKNKIKVRIIFMFIPVHFYCLLLIICINIIYNFSKHNIKAP